jgi:hypothetical protein
VKFFEDIGQFFQNLFGLGGSTPPTPRQLLHGRHPLYPVILGVQDGLIPDEVSAGQPQFCGDPQPCGIAPLLKIQYQSVPFLKSPYNELTNEQYSRLRANGYSDEDIKVLIAHPGELKDLLNMLPPLIERPRIPWPPAGPLPTPSGPANPNGEIGSL